jgi:hyperosmotically inducible protein
VNGQKGNNKTRQQKGERTMKAIHSAALMAAAFALLVISVPVYASNMDVGIESSARKSYVFKTYLKDDDIKIQSKDGAVTLTGTVAQEPHKALAQETVASLPGVKSVDNRLELKGEPGARSADALVSARVKLELLSHRNLSATKTDVQVKLPDQRSGLLRAYCSNISSCS